MGVTEVALVVAPLNQLIFTPLVVRLMLAGERPQTVAFVPDTESGAMAIIPTEVTTLHKPDEMVAVKVLSPKILGVNVAGLVACPVFQKKVEPLVLSKLEVGTKPQTVVLVLVTVTKGCANTLTTVVTLHTPELIVAL